MSGHLNFDEIGQPIARIDKKTVYLSDKPVEDGADELKTKNGAVLQQIPNKSKERDVLYIFGQSGSGKSYYIQQYLKVYHKTFPKNDVYMFSSIDKDPAFDKMEYLKRIKIKEDAFMGADLTSKEFENSLCIFDDVDVITIKKVRVKVMNLLNNLLETGRHTKTSVIYTSHLSSNGLESRRILNEAHSITLFPANLNGKSSKYFLDNYLGLTKEQIKKVKDISSRAITVVKSYPQVILYEGGACLLKTF
jgi:ABC-type dipeptide/oligopeptide/nickel transport system ATPase component